MTSEQVTDDLLAQGLEVVASRCPSGVRRQEERTAAGHLTAGSTLTPRIVDVAGAGRPKTVGVAEVVRDRSASTVQVVVVSIAVEEVLTEVEEVLVLTVDDPLVLHVRTRGRIEDHLPESFGYLSGLRATVRIPTPPGAADADGRHVLNAAAAQVERGGEVVGGLSAQIRNESDAQTIKCIGKVVTTTIGDEVTDDADRGVEVVVRVDDVEHLIELFVLVTRSVAVGVVETDPVAIDVVHTVEVNRVLAGAVLVVGLSEVVTGLSFRTTADDTGAIVDVGASVVVVGNRVRATRARTVIVRGGSVIVVGAFVSTTGNLVLVTHSVTVSIVQALTVTVDVVHTVDVTGVNAERVVRISKRVVVIVTGLGIGAALGFVLVADSVAVGIVQALTITIHVVDSINVNRVRAGSIVVRGSSAVVTGGFVGTTGDLILVTHSVAIRIVVAVAVTIQVGGATVHIDRVLAEAVVRVREITGITGFRVSTPFRLIGIADAVAVIVVRVDRTVCIARLTGVVCENTGAIIDGGSRIVVTGVSGSTTSASQVLTGTVIIRGGSVIVTGSAVLAAPNLIFVAHEVAISVIQAVSIAVDRVVRVAVGVGTAVVIIRGRSVIVTGCFIRTTGHFVFIANAIAVRVIQAIAITVQVIGSRVRAGAVVIRGSCIIVASRLIRTARNFILVADAIGVCVVQAVAVTVEIGGFRVRAAVIVQSGCGVVVAGRLVRTTRAGCTGTEVEGVPELVGTVTVNEDLDVELTIEFTRGGELTGQHLQVVSGHTVGVSVQGIPCTTDAVIDGDVATRKTSTRIEVGEPGVVVGLHRAHVGFTRQRVRRALQTNGHPRVVSEVRVHREQQAVDAVRNPSTKRSMVEVRRRIDERGIRGITRHGGQEVVRTVHGDINMSGAVSRQVDNTEGTGQDADVLVDDFQLDVIPLRSRSGIHSDLLDLGKGGGHKKKEGRTERCETHHKRFGSFGLILSLNRSVQVPQSSRSHNVP